MFDRKKIITEKPWKNMLMTKPFCPSKIQDIKTFKRIKKKKKSEMASLR